MVSAFSETFRRFFDREGNKRNGFNNIENVNLGDDHWITKGRK